MSRLVLQQKICISQKKNVCSISVISENMLEILPSDMVRTWSKKIRTGLKCFLYFQQRKWYQEVSGLAENLIQNREVNRVIGYSIIELVESIPQVWEVVAVLFLEANSFYYMQLMLFDLAHQIPRILASRYNFSNPVIKTVLFSLSSSRAKEEPVRVLSSLSISL